MKKVILAATIALANINLFPDSEIGGVANETVDRATHGGGPETTIEDDILGGTNWDDVSRSMPMLPEGLYDLEIASIETHLNEAKGTKSLKLVLKTTVEARAVSGDVLGKGFPIFHYIGLTPSETNSKNRIQQAIALFLDGVGAKAILPLEAWKGQGKIVRAKLIVAPEKDGFPASNRVKSFIAAGK